MTRARRPRVDWMFLKDGGRTIYCARCGAEAAIELPIPVWRLVNIVDGFNLMHWDCKPAESS